MSVFSKFPQFVMALTHLEHLYFDGYTSSAIMKTVSNYKQIVSWTGSHWKQYKGH